MPPRPSRRRTPHPVRDPARSGNAFPPHHIRTTHRATAWSTTVTGGTGPIDLPGPHTPLTSTEVEPQRPADEPAARACTAPKPCCHGDQAHSRGRPVHQLPGRSPVGATPGATEPPVSGTPSSLSAGPSTTRRSPSSVQGPAGREPLKSAVATLATWRFLRKLRCSTTRITNLVQVCPHPPPHLLRPRWEKAQ